QRRPIEATERHVVVLLHDALPHLVEDGDVLALRQRRKGTEIEVGPVSASVPGPGGVDGGGRRRGLGGRTRGRRHGRRRGGGILGRSGSIARCEDEREDRHPSVTRAGGTSSRRGRHSYVTRSSAPRSSTTIS